MASDPILWKAQCDAQGWTWRASAAPHPPPPTTHADSDDEGMGDEEEPVDGLTRHLAGLAVDEHEAMRARSRRTFASAPPASAADPAPRDYKLLHQTHVRLRGRVLRGAYEISALQSRGAPQAARAHTNTIYCLTLYTDPASGEQVLLTGSKDRSVREWDLRARRVRRVLEEVHMGSVLSVCAKDGWAASGGSDCAVAVYEMGTGRVIRSRRDHEDSVLCVRFDERRLVTCSKGASLLDVHNDKRANKLGQTAQYGLTTFRT